jgi:hypothetical protein
MKRVDFVAAMDSWHEKNKFSVAKRRKLELMWKKFMKK